VENTRGISVELKQVPQKRLAAGDRQRALQQLAAPQPR
jgi:hypothetical protein